MKPFVHFLLVPDGNAARRLRRIIATQTPCMGVKIGTWPELIEQARGAYLISKRSSDWEVVFSRALKNVVGAFWSQSLEVAPQETASEVEAALFLLVGGTHPSDENGFIGTCLDRLPERPRKHVEDIARLLVELDGRLPEQLETIQQLITADSTNAIRKLLIYHLDEFPVLTCWQAELIKKLNKDADLDPTAELFESLDSLRTDIPPEVPGSSLEFLQKHLFSASSEKISLDPSVQWLGVRDDLQAAEVAAGMAQQILLENSGLLASEIGLLVPDTFEYSLAVNDAFTTAGIPLSGLSVDHWQRDLGKETVFHFLYCRQKPSPAMALSACLSSPLMPWTKEQGAVLAQTVMDGDYQLQPFRSATQSARRMLDLLREGDERPDSLVAAIRTFVEMLDGGEQFNSDVDRAKLIAEELCEVLRGKLDIDWASLRRISSPKNISTSATTDFNLEGVTVWREGHEPWRPVRFLIVLGFSSGHYPLASKDSTVFVSEDLAVIRENLGLTITIPSEQLHDRRARFKRQLGAVSDSLTFVIPRRNPMGAAKSPSESLVFMFELFCTFEDAESLILEMDVATDRDRVQFVPPAEICHPSPPREFAVEDIQFDFDLLALRLDEQGNIKPESPSSLETLMVSRLAWLLRRINAEPLGWKPERLDVMLQGALTHHVFEQLFQTINLIPESESISAQIVPLLDSAMRFYAPFLRSAQWQVERKHLASSIQNAALSWCEILTMLNAEVLGTEEWLAGTLDGIPIHGQADILLGLPDDRLLVVDYKKSSARSRRPRMQKGYDCQANLYRTMLQTGAPKNEENTVLLEKLRLMRNTGIVYFMTNDQSSLSDALVRGSRAIPGWEVFENDVSQMAMDLIRKRLKEVGEGQLYLNREGDREFFGRQAGIEPYALDNSPLIPLFIIPGKAREVE
ncbi:MAG: PD-(D/E)XK nuclease family protein [Gammaproteobacteria bacterium]|nr:PD-(D/E)XK nuclease family protein [Gammaproteobacteria bacterium]